MFGYINLWKDPKVTGGYRANSAAGAWKISRIGKRGMWKAVPEDAGLTALKGLTIKDLVKDFERHDSAYLYGGADARGGVSTSRYSGNTAVAWQKGYDAQRKTIEAAARSPVFLSPTLETIRQRVQAYDAELDRLELPPNGDDYNALVEIIRNGVTLLPRKEGR